MLLSEAAAAMNSTAPFEAEITDVTIDSRSITEGCLFFAIKGDNFDGHSFAAAALADGAAAVVCSTETEGTQGRCVMVEDTRRAFLALAAYNRSRYSIPVVGLTGSVGKTTTKDMVAAVLGSKYKTLKTQGNLNNDIGLPRMCMRLDGSYEAAVLEMGMNDFGEISRLTKTARPTIGLITNIGVSHIERLGSRDGILKAKLEILEGMESNAPLLLNGDDDKLRGAMAEIKNPVLTYGIDSDDCDCRASDIEQSENGLSFTLTYGGKIYKAVLPVIGRHNVYNACAAFLCGMLTDVSPEQALDGLRSYAPDAHRQRIISHGGVTFIEDCYNASPDSISASLSVLRSLPCTGRRIAVLGDMLELGEHARQAHFDCGVKAAQCGVNVLFGYGPCACFYIEGAGNAVESCHFFDKDALAQRLADMLTAGDVVLFKASRGMKLEEVYTRVYELMGEDNAAEK